ncbi:MAG: hypothetical protein C5B52_17690 [Bacteroidetes bacterium]|nr:MAG: hypothetical protein C5B52_17690 [Bacteroidota bacterium]
MVEVFKTNVEEKVQASFIITLLKGHFPEARINFDLTDCDRILRLEGDDLITYKVVHLVNEQGFYCTVLE